MLISCKTTKGTLRGRAVTDGTMVNDLHLCGHARPLLTPFVAFVPFVVLNPE